MLSHVFFVRKNWIAVAREAQRDQRRIVIVVMAVMFLATVGVYGVLALQLDKGIESFVAEALSYGLFLAVPVWYALRQRADGWQRALAAYVLFLAVMLVTDWFVKGRLDTELVLSERAKSPRLFVSGIMLLIWVAPLWLMRAYPTQARGIGLNFERLGHKVLFGTLGAIVLIAHLWITLLYSGVSLSFKPGPFLFFTCCYEIAAQSLSEELFFRGFLFNYLYHVRQQRLRWSILIVSLLNVLIYVAKFRPSGGVFGLVGPVFYAFVMAVLNAMLFRQVGGILPGLILNVLFSMAGILR
ncbi:MAG: type II CAAX prenyl endopeptidase Rce1 family protein [Chloroflexota bacterium]